MKSFSRMMADRIAGAERKRHDVEQTAKMSAFNGVVYVAPTTAPALKASRKAPQEKERKAA